MYTSRAAQASRFRVKCHVQCLRQQSIASPRLVNSQRTGPSGGRRSSRQWTSRAIDAKQQLHRHPQRAVCYRRQRQRQCQHFQKQSRWLADRWSCECIATATRLRGASASTAARTSGGPYPWSACAPFENHCTRIIALQYNLCSMFNHTCWSSVNHRSAKLLGISRKFEVIKDF